MTQQNCEFCRRDGATTLETPATWAICLNDNPLVYSCDRHLTHAQDAVVSLHGENSKYHAVPLDDKTETKLGWAKIGLPLVERSIAAARIRLKTIKKAGSNFGVCRECSNRLKVPKKEWDRSSNPRCPSCGGMLDREQPAMGPRELTRHENALRRDF